jgi:undecaprenyl-phosphate 4-deoxy-4-formamido-L-arabinose transferase
MAVLGFLSALVVIIEAIFFVTPSGWASTMTLMLLIAGVQFMILGVLGEYVGRAFLSANGKPQGVVREVMRAKVTRTETAE